MQDVKVFSQETGLFFTDTAGRQVAVKDWQTWMGETRPGRTPCPPWFSAFWPVFSAYTPLRDVACTLKQREYIRIY